jgi:hypothetical protein
VIDGGELPWWRYDELTLVMWRVTGRPHSQGHEGKKREGVENVQTVKGSETVKGRSIPIARALP